MTYRNQITNTIEDFIIDPAARGVVASMFAAVHNVEKVMKGEVTDDVRVGVMQMFFDLTVGLGDNPFWRQHSGYLLPVFQMAANAWRDSFEHLSDPKDEASNIAFLTTRNTMCELAVAVLYCEQGAAGLAKNSVSLRKAVMKREVDS